MEECFFVFCNFGWWMYGPFVDVSPEVDKCRVRFPASDAMLADTAFLM
jgi:hypothetical protein